MTLIAKQKLCDLDPAARAWLTSVFGSDTARFADDAELHLELRSEHRSEIAPTQTAPALAAIMARMEDRLRTIPDAEIEDALDEAMKSVRPTYRQ